MASIIKADTLQSTTANVFILNSSGTEYARFDSTGVFQLTNPTTFPAGTVSLPSITATGDTNTGLYFPAADTIAFVEGGVEAVRIDSSGNVGIGTSSPATRLHVAQAQGTAPELRITSATIYAKVIADDAVEGMMRLDGSNKIGFNVDGTERARIDSSGNLLVGTTSNVDNFKATIKFNSSATNGLEVLSTNEGTNYFIGCSNSSAFKFFVLSSGNVQNTNNSYGAISDAKLKENIADASPKLDKLMGVKVRTYNLIGDTQKQIGVVAQELETIFPSLIEETVDRDSEGKDAGTTTKAVKYSVFVPMIIKAIQEQQALITALTATTTSQTEAITALTARIATLESTP